MNEDLLRSALHYAHSGLSVFPVKPGCKGPRGKWKEYQSHIASDEQIQCWFGTGEPRGICIIAGEVSGCTDENGVICGLEFIDFDDADVLDRFLSIAGVTGVEDILLRLPTEETPRGGRHWGWRCEEWEGSLTLAERKISVGKTERIKTLIETRGEGGACTVCPTPKGIHPERPEKAYELIMGSWVDIPIITPDERRQILELASSLTEYVRPARVREKSPLQRGTLIQGERPGDRLNAEAGHAWWQELLERHGWRLVHHLGDIDYWQRPGKDKHDKNTSATYGATGPYFYVFSSNADPFEARQGYQPFAALSLLDYGGDFKACAKALKPTYAPVFRQNGHYDNSPSDHSAIDAALAYAIEQEESSYAGFDFDLTEKGKVKETLNNYVKMYSLHREWKGRLAFNTFARRQEIDGQPMTPKERIAMGVWACEQYRIDGRYRGIRDEAILHACMQHTYDPLLDFVNALPKWDGGKRLDTWMSLWCGAPDTELSAWIGRMLITQMIARACLPGSIARYVVVLQGEEATGKSQLVMALGHPWAITFDMSMDKKEAHMAVQGAWVAELAELDTLRRTTETRLKSFVAQSSDNFVPKYSNDREDIPRRCVFVGTTNEDDYLIGETGNTRFLPIKTGRIKLEQIRENRDQMFAEAKIFFEKRLDDWWQEPENLKDLLREAREERRVMNVYEQSLRFWVDGLDEDGRRLHNRDWIDETTWQEIAKEFLGLDRKEWKDKGLQMQIASAMRSIGWKKIPAKRAGKAIKLWVRCEDQVTTVAT